MGLFPLGNRNFHLCNSLLVEIDREGNDSKSFELNTFAQRFDLPLVHEEFAGTPLFVVEDRSAPFGVGGNTGVDES